MKPPWRGRRRSHHERGGRKGQEEAGLRSVVADEVSPGVLLLRDAPNASSEGTGPPDGGVADLARATAALRPEKGTTMVVAGYAGQSTVPFWWCLSETLDRLRREGCERVVLVMRDAARAEGRESTARRVAEDWGLEVVAPRGAPLLVPGGTLFVADTGAGEPAGWWSHAPGAAPRHLGPRLPVPAWDSALAALPGPTAGDSVAQSLPAGLLLRPRESAPAAPGDLAFAVPADPDRPLLLVSSQGGRSVPPECLTQVLAALPGRTRPLIRLAPGDRRDILRLAQVVANSLGTEVEVLTGLPLLGAEDEVSGAAPPTVPLLVGTDGQPSWSPYAQAVVCLPNAEGRHPRAPRLLRWRSPLPATGRRRGEAEDEWSAPLTGPWRAHPTRAGLWVGTDAEVPFFCAVRHVDPERVTIDVGTPDEPLERSLERALAVLLDALEDDVRRRAALCVHGAHDTRRAAALQRLAVRHGVALAPRTVAAPRAGNGPGTGDASSAGTAPPVADAPPPGAAAGGPHARGASEGGAHPPAGHSPVTEAPPLWGASLEVGSPLGIGQGDTQATTSAGRPPWVAWEAGGRARPERPTGPPSGAEDVRPAQAPGGASPDVSSASADRPPARAEDGAHSSAPSGNQAAGPDAQRSAPGTEGPTGPTP